MSSSREIYFPKLHVCDKFCKETLTRVPKGPPGLFGYVSKPNESWDHKTQTCEDGKPGEQNVTNELSLSIDSISRPEEVWEPTGPYLFPDDEVISDRMFDIDISYPLSKVARVSVEFKNAGVTRRQLAEAILNAYQHIYSEEEDSSPGKCARGSKPYGIYVHTIDDLWIEGVFFTRDPKTGRGIVSLSMGS